ncbi:MULTISPECIES: helix-turn-helix domain-containing protein [unclassified Pseudomonas]|uniref:helix-turn-helix domain-containing protein n=1 Tax=unclassified Pseudomonas TaxID=196821 RepID=UPI0007617680|nr:MULTISPECIES: helix-turn-helix domain-containing protein [unclassified Pseudomonas]MBK4990657.1 helix-turn-helix domain-containing protein [Pseudomonas sp. S36]
MRAIREPSPVEAHASPSFVCCETSDVLEQASVLPKWNQEYVQISEGAFTGALQDLSLGPIQVFRETMDKAVDQHGLPWRNSFAIGVPNAIVGDGFWCGDRLEQDSVFFLKPNSELRFRTPCKSDIYVAVVDMTLLGEYAESVEGVDAARITAISGASAASAELCSAIRSSLGHIFTGLSTNPHALENDVLLRDLLSETLHTISASLSHLSQAPQHHPGQFVHRHIVEKAREFILSRYSLPPSVQEICLELRISRRTLHYAFQKVLGINPVSYLRYVRLHGARQMLLAAGTGQVLISEVAAQWGFLHAGMFCTYYRQLFGETASTTLMRNAPTHYPCDGHG